MSEFLDGLTGEIILPFDLSYDELRQGYNNAIQKYPFLIVYCFEICDVSNAVKWARKHSISIRIRSGGHNYEGYSNGNCTLIIDLSCMKKVDINEYDELIYVQGGATNQDVYEYVSSRGYPFPGGTCPTVGVSGYALGGGWGLSCRHLGLGCDNLVEIELVNYEGKLIIANKNCNSDLFWAIRGAGGGNFGVVVNMTFKLPEAVDKVTLIEIDYLNVCSEEQEKFVTLWQDWLEKADNRMTLISFYYRNAKFIIWLETVWEENEYINVNKDWIKNKFPSLQSITTGSYINFPYLELDNHLEEYFGCHKEELKFIKEKYDPLNIFSFPQSIDASNKEYHPILYKSVLFDKENNWNSESNKNHREFRYVSKNTGLLS